MNVPEANYNSRICRTRRHEREIKNIPRSTFDAVLLAFPQNQPNHPHVHLRTLPQPGTLLKCNHPAPSTISTKTALRLADANGVKFSSWAANASFVDIFFSSHKISACHLRKGVAARRAACMCGEEVVQFGGDGRGEGMGEERRGIELRRSSAKMQG